MLSPSAYYNQQKQHFTGLLNKATKTANTISTLRLWTAIGFVIIAIWAFRSGGGAHWWVAIVFLVAFLVLIRIHHHLSAQCELYKLHLSILNNELRAIDGDFSAFADGGQFVDIAHPYSFDLDIFGKGSIYQMLCRTVTIDGARMLADRLSTIAPSKDTIIGRQEVIAELGTLPGLQQNFRVAGSLEPEEPNSRARLEEWLRGDERFINNKLIIAITVIMPLISLACIAYSVITGDPHPLLGLIIVVNWTLLGVLQKRIKPTISQIGNAEPFIDKTEQLLKEVASNEFKAPWLQRSAADAKSSLKHIARFKSHIKLFESRENVFLGPALNSLFLFDLYCLLRLEAWRRKHKTVLLDAMDSITSLDVYTSCAVYAFNNPANIYPQVTTAGTEIKAEDLRHPLLASATAIGNDVSLGRQEQFYLLTGANMTGKSTFIRTIGVSNVLCSIGVPLPAAGLSLPILDMYTSMRITDSVQDDISYFRAELNRIKRIMDTVRTSPHPFLILLDEPLRGTNSTDKQQGTRSIVETLLTFHAVGIVATHDTGLCDMEASYPGKVSNYYFESKVEQNALSFDFKLKKGGSTSNNATILMRQMGIIN